MQHATSYDYLMRSLDAALKYMDIYKRHKKLAEENEELFRETTPVCDRTFSSNSWMERGIAETLFKITMVYFNQKNYNEAKKYANYSI